MPYFIKSIREKFGYRKRLCLLFARVLSHRQKDDADSVIFYTAVLWQNLLRVRECVILKSRNPHRKRSEEMKLKELLGHDNTIVADGAMGTYISKLTGESSKGCELVNLQNPGLIRRIHNEYLDAGAQLLRSNTFAANTSALELPLDEVLQVIRTGYRLVQECAGSYAVPAADIGPIFSAEETEHTQEYHVIADCFLEMGARTFVFETFSDPEPVLECAEYIRGKCSEAEIIASFTFSSEGMTQQGISLRAIAQMVEESPNISVLGMNCGVGPAHLLKLAKSLNGFSKPISVMPNAGYPTIENGRTVFTSDAAYFATVTAEMENAGVRILGGCCGTMPSYIEALAGKLTHVRQNGVDETERTQEPDIAPRLSRLGRRLSAGKFVVIAELDPPYTSDLSKVMQGARHLCDAGIDGVTISDSPLARARIDSVLCSAKIKREIGIDVIPHICCRDRNANALRSIVLGAHAEGIRSILSITGDPVPEEERGFIKQVFNLNSQQMMAMIQGMNREIFNARPMLIGGALNPNAANQAAEIKRACRKKESGAAFLLTQPVFDPARKAFLNEVRAAGIKVLAGIMPLVSWRNAHYMNNEVPGITIPENVLEQFIQDMEKEAAEQTGISIAVELAAELRDSCDGFYFMTPFNRTGIICEIVTRLKNLGILED